MRRRPDVVTAVYVDAAARAGRSAVTEVTEAASAAGLDIHEVSTAVLGAMADTTTPQGVLAVCRPVDVALDKVLDGARLVCLLAHVRDPGNAGTVIRGADAAGADAVLVSDASVDVYNPKVVRATAGSLFHLPIVRGLPLLPTLDRLGRQGLTRYAADGAGTTSLDRLDAQTLRRPHAWVMGNEAWGLPDEVRAACDEVVAVPIYGQAESLNLAMAATVCLYASATAQHPPGGTGVRDRGTS